VRKLGVYCPPPTTAVGATAVSDDVFGTGIAAAGDYAGQDVRRFFASKEPITGGGHEGRHSKAGAGDTCPTTTDRDAFAVGAWIKGDNFDARKRTRGCQTETAMRLWHPTKGWTPRGGGEFGEQTRGQGRHQGAATGPADSASASG